VSRRVEIAPRAERQLDAIDRWWRENRTGAPGLLLEEFGAAVELIAAMPLAGRRYPRAPVPGVRRVLMRATRYHVYYIVKESSILIVALWSAVRGSGPHPGSLR